MSKREAESYGQAQTILTGESRRTHKIIIIGGGFAGVAAARALRKVDADVVIVDKRNHHIFQPLLYQVATALLAPGEISSPIRQLVKACRNVTTLLGEATHVDASSSTVNVRCVGHDDLDLPYDYLIIAAGLQPSYFGHDDFEPFAPGLKTIADAEAIRTKILNAYEAAELADTPAERDRQLSFVLVGSGPTGVELAASLAQFASLTLKSDFRRIDPTATRVGPGGPTRPRR